MASQGQRSGGGRFVAATRSTRSTPSSTGSRPRSPATRSGAPVGAQEVHDVVFRVRFGGYDEWQVDLHLDRVERQLGELEERGGALRRAAAAWACRTGWRRPDAAAPLGPPTGWARRCRRRPPARDGPARPDGSADRRQPPPGSAGPMGRRTAPGGPPPMPQRPMPPGRAARRPVRRSRPAAASAPGSTRRARLRRPDGPSATSPPAHPDADAGRLPGPDDRLRRLRAAGRHGKMDMTAEIRMPDREPRGGRPDARPRWRRLMGAPGSAARRWVARRRWASPAATSRGSTSMRRTFQVRRFGSGYDPIQVDRLFEGVLAAVRPRPACRPRGRARPEPVRPGARRLLRGRGRRRPCGRSGTSCGAAEPSRKSTARRSQT